MIWKLCIKNYWLKKELVDYIRKMVKNIFSKLRIGIAIVFLLTIHSCKLFYPSTMLQQKDYQYFDLAAKEINQYIISPGDEISLRVYSRDGFRLVDVLGGSSTDNNNSTNNNNINNRNNQVSYWVNADGFVRFPVIGEMYVKGYTQPELQKKLEEQFSTLFVNPYVVLLVENRRCFVFRQNIGGQVVSLNNYPTSILEIIAKSGGLGGDLKSYNIRLISGDKNNPIVREIDLSTVEGLKNSNVIVNSNDIIVISARRRYFSKVLTEITPFISAVSLLTSIIILSKTLAK